MEIRKLFLTHNDCYKQGGMIIPGGIVVHSTGADNKKLWRYIQPDDGMIGNNPYGNDWNRPGVGKCVHAFIGADKNGEIRIYQTLPWNYKCWGCGRGPKGSYNNSYIQFEICEDNLADRDYFDHAFDAAVWLCRYLMRQYPAIKIQNVVSHAEAHKRGYASGHKDCDHWQARFGKNMDWFRNRIKQEEMPEEKMTAEKVLEEKVLEEKALEEKVLEEKAQEEIQEEIQEEKAQEEIQEEVQEEVQEKKARQDTWQEDLRPVNPYPAPDYTLYRFRPGMQKEHIRWMQWALNRMNYGLKLDGKFGPATEAALRDAQKRLGLKPDGRCGPATRAALASVSLLYLSEGSL